jgi:hypothetical protein
MAITTFAVTSRGGTTTSCTPVHDPSVMMLHKSPMDKPVLPQQRRRPRRVTFEESHNVTYENKQWGWEDSRQSWYTKVDYDTMKDAAYNQAKQIWKKERRTATDGSSSSYSSILLRVYDACCEVTHEEPQGSILSEPERKLFQQIVGKAQTRTGLEKMCIREIAYDKRQRRIELTDLVLQVQAALNSSSSSFSSSLSQLSVEESVATDYSYRAATLLRTSCETVSRASRLFAREMALALAASLH